MSLVEIRHVTHLPPQILALEKEAVGEGFRFVTRLIAEWHSGANRFDAPRRMFYGSVFEPATDRHRRPFS